MKRSDTEKIKEAMWRNDSAWLMAIAKVCGEKRIPCSPDFLKEILQTKLNVPKEVLDGFPFAMREDGLDTVLEKIITICQQ